MPFLQLTKTAVEAAKPGSRDYEVHDKSRAGFLRK